MNSWDPFYYSIINTECHEIGLIIEASQSPKAVIRRLQQARKFSLADTAVIVLLEISLVLMLLLSSNPPPSHPGTHLTCQMQDAELLPAGQPYNGQMLFIFSTGSSIKSLMSLLLYCCNDARLVFTWGLPITGFVQRPFCPSFVGLTQDNSPLSCCLYSCVWICAL